jgi:hypothetical protein
MASPGSLRVVTVPEVSVSSIFPAESGFVGNTVGCEGAQKEKGVNLIG